MTQAMPGYLVYRWWAANHETRTITEDGAYAKDEVPDEYSGPKLEAKILQRIIFANSAGELLELRYDDLADVMNKQKQKGLGATIHLPGGYTATVQGAAGPNVEWALVMNPALPQEVAAKAELMWSRIMAEQQAD